LKVEPYIWTLAQEQHQKFECRAFDPASFRHRSAELKYKVYSSGACTNQQVWIVVLNRLCTYICGIVLLVVTHCKAPRPAPFRVLPLMASWLVPE